MKTAIWALFVGFIAVFAYEVSRALGASDAAAHATGVLLGATSGSLIGAALDAWRDIFRTDK